MNFTSLIFLITVITLCIMLIVDRICRCVEHCAEVSAFGNAMKGPSAVSTVQALEKIAALSGKNKLKKESVDR